MVNSIRLNLHYAGGSPVFDVFNTWCQVQTESSYGVIPEEPSPMIWDVHLSTGEDPGKLDLTPAYQGLRARQAMIPVAQNLVYKCLQQSKNIEKQNQSFAVPIRKRNSNPLDVLYDWLAIANSRQGSVDAESFDTVRDNLQGILGHSINELQKFVTQIEHALTRMAYVRTITETSINAITEVYWTGHISTHINPGLSSELVKLHSQSLILVLLTRWNWLHLASTITGTALHLMAAASTGFGMLTALPITYRLITSLVNEMCENKKYSQY
jgi:hypothetical protein